MQICWNNPGFILCPQNGESIIGDVSTSAMRGRYLQASQAIGVEDLFYHFGTQADQAYRFQLLAQYSQAGKKVFNIEYLNRSQWSAYLTALSARPFPIIPYAGAPDRALDELIPDFPQVICGRGGPGANLLLLE